MGRSTIQRAALLLGLAVVSGCAENVDADQEQERVGQAIQPIIRGITSGTEHDSVVILTTFRNGQRVSLCTATLVAPNMVITARHCVSDTDSSTACSKEGTPITGGGVKANRDPKNLVVFLGKDSVSPDTTVEKNGSARGAKVIVSPASTICNRDVAFVVLDKKLDAPVSPIRLGPPAMNEKVAAVGWGIDETGNLPKSREVRANIPLVGVGPSLYPDHTSYGYGSSEFMIGESACAGDSGSPTFAKSGALVGVAARAGNGKPRDPNNYASTCMGSTAHAVYSHLAAHKDLVTQAFKASGEEMWLEGQPDPRAPKTQTTPPETTAEEDEPATTKKAGAADIPLPSEDPESPTAAPSAGGCSLTLEPQKGAVENAAGILALFMMVVGLRRRFGRSRNEGTRASMHSIP